MKVATKQKVKRFIKGLGWTYVWLSLATFAIAGIFFAFGLPVWGFGTILISPFPCPTGLPC